MTNKYIKIVMEPTKSGIGGALTAKATFRLDNIVARFTNIDVKIDTGCSISTIPLARFKALKLFCDKLKKEDIKNGIAYERSYGVESGGEPHKVPLTEQEKMDCPALKFRHGISDFSIGGVPIDADYIYLNYNRSGNILIGMDILKTWDIHMGTANTGETVFLACPQKQPNADYYRELEHLFSYTVMKI